MRALLAALAALSLFVAACGASPQASAAGHPRLIVRASDVDRLRSWATATNPMWSQGLAPLARTAKKRMNKGMVPDQDTGGNAYEPFPSELYAELFAFMSLVDPNPKARADYGRRARTCLMYALNRAAKGPKAGKPFRDPQFSTDDRSRYYGEAFGLTVDWAYPYFSKGDKQTIRKVFLRWAKEQYSGYPLSNISDPKPHPGTAPNDPALISDVGNNRWSLNNYFLAHARNLGLMAMALDPADDPGNRLRGEVQHVVGSWLFMIDNALRTEAAGGLSPEGFEYGPEATGRLAQLLVALRTAGEDGDQSAVTQIPNNPFWDASITGYLESLPPVPTQAPGAQSYLGQIWQAATFGDEESSWTLDPISLFGLLAIDAADRGDTVIPNAVRWIATNVPPGGPDELLARVGNTDGLFGSIIYFMLFDPAAPPVTDPRPGLPTTYVATGLNRTLARTCWCDSARMFVHKLSYNHIDHQIGDGNDFGFFRGGEWLTKNRAGYDSQQTLPLNELAIENDRPSHHAKTDYPYSVWKNGGQYILTPSGDPTLVARSFGDGYVAITGDATKLYNSDYERSTDVLHASRSIVWLEPDHIVVYDRATTKTSGRFKRFWLQTATNPAVDGRRATVTTKKGQQLFVNTLLPEDATLEASKNSKTIGTPAVGEPMKYRLKVEAPGGPADVRFLNVLQGADGGAAADPAARVKSSAGAVYDGAVVAGTAVLFPVDMTGGGSTTVPLPAGVKRILVTGLV
ncbi:MAG: hypothetical protein QOF76_3706, partial [Solirubrobacteraceae bacterium]|nr:hypothetical protein [Solirubrobacteraceae bacterium]